MTANVFLPAHACLVDWGQWEMYVWVLGILLITVASKLKLGLGPIFQATTYVVLFSFR